MKSSKIFFLIAFFLTSQTSVFAEWIWSPEQGKFINASQDLKGDADELFDKALELYTQKDIKKSTEMFEFILKKFPKSNVAPESQYRVGTLSEEAGDFLKAHKSYQSLIKNYPQSNRFEEVVEREYKIGLMFLSGTKGKLLGFNIRPSFPLAVEVFQKIVEMAPYSEFGDKAQFQLGLAYQNAGQFDQAIDAYQTLIERYPQSTLLKQTRLQIAETAYSKTSVQGRDQSALEEAYLEAENYLKKYPDSEEAAKAKKISEAVDELNAEKTYRVGLYYEKENYLESALIYYRDVAKSYPNTTWAAKASERTRTFQDPVGFQSEQNAALQQKLSELKSKLAALNPEQKNEREILQSQINQTTKKIKSLGKEKNESLKRRKADLSRREKELKAKFLELDKRKERFKDNQSADFLKAIDRWQASLEAERDELAKERELLEKGDDVSTAEKQEPKFYEKLFSFGGDDAVTADSINRIDEKELYKISKKKKELLERKEQEYKHYSDLQTSLVPEHSKSGLQRKYLREETKKTAEETKNPKLLARAKEIESLDTKYNEKLALYEKNYGTLAKQELIAFVESKSSAGGSFASSFASGEEALQGKTLQELLELKMHLKEQIKSGEEVITTLSTSFDKELNRKEQKEFQKQLNDQKLGDLKTLRKQTKAIEKDLRKRYEDIQDRNDHKQELLKQLKEALNPSEEKTFLSKVAKPFKGAAFLAKSFVVGLPYEDETLIRDAANRTPDQVLISKYQEEIEAESLIIQAQAQEIQKLEKELEILNAKSSLSEGVKFRSSFVKVPYDFIEEAVDDAKRIIPGKKRQDILLSQLDKQTNNVAGLKAKLNATEAVILEKTPKKQVDESTVESSGQIVSEDAKEQEKRLRDEIVTLGEQLEVSYSLWTQERLLELGDNAEEDLSVARQKSKEYRALKKAGKRLAELIDDELDLDDEEIKIFEKRNNEANSLLKKTASKATEQDIRDAQSRIQNRLSELRARKNFLLNEKERFK